MINHSPDGTARGLPRSDQPRWTRGQIRAARLAPLGPLLEKRGHNLVETGGGNFKVSDFPGLIVKDCYWRWPGRGMAGDKCVSLGGGKCGGLAGGNAIDFLVQVLGRSFHDAMREIDPPVA